MDYRWILIAVIIVLVCIPLEVTAYANDNMGGHLLINQFAIESIERNIADLLPKGTSLRGEECWGWAWDETDGIADVGPRNMIRVYRSKSLQNWIMDGGFSADEPERTMALVHFYDPRNRALAYLTDYQTLVDLGTRYYGGNFVNPERSAVDWAFDHDRPDLAYFIQDYSWNDGLRYYRDALADTSRTNDKYGQAWRAVGETMHLVSDMTIPAHVRNDGHPTFDQDPYENSVGPYQVRQFRYGEPLEINYNQGSLENLMVRIADSVNKKFYSADTTPVRYVTLSSGDYFTSYSYPQPSLEGLVPDADGYYYLEGRALAREDMSVFQPALEAGVLRNVYRLDEKVLNDQRSVLIPTAIQASAEVLDRFLPRFEAKLSIRKFLPEDPEDDQYEVYTTLKQVHTEPDAWSGYDLIVRNGANMVETPPGGTPTEKPLSLTPVWATPPPDPNFNNWGDLYKFKPGTKIQMKYDLGGYVIKSNEVIIPELPTPTPTTSKPVETITVSSTSTAVPRASWGCANTAACTPDHPEFCCPGTTFDDSPCPGCELCCEWFMDEDPDVNRIVCTPPWEDGIDVGNKYDAGCWQVRGACNCKTGKV